MLAPSAARAEPAPEFVSSDNAAVPARRLSSLLPSGADQK